MNSKTIAERRANILHAVIEELVQQGLPPEANSERIAGEVLSNAKLRMDRDDGEFGELEPELFEIMDRYLYVYFNRYSGSFEYQNLPITSADAGVSAHFIIDCDHLLRRILSKNE